MVESIDIQKSRARNELAKLSDSLVPQSHASYPSTLPSVSIKELSDIDDVSLAIDMVRDTMEVLQEFRAITSSQNKKIDNALAERSLAIEDLNLLQKKYDDVVKEADSLRSTCIDLQKSKDQLYEERSQLMEHNKIIESRLKELVGIVIASFGSDTNRGD